MSEDITAGVKERQSDLELLCEEFEQWRSRNDLDLN